MLKLCRFTKVKVLFLVLVYVLNFNLFESSAAILEKGLLMLLSIRRATRETLLCLKHLPVFPSQQFPARL